MFRRAGRQPIFAMRIDTQKGESVTSATPLSPAQELDWHVDHEEGQLAVDVFETSEAIIVVSTLAGAVASGVDVSIHNELLTIRGVRRSPIEAFTAAQPIHEECYWGKFSRTILLPVDVKGELAKAQYRNGVLTIIVPKREIETHIPIRIIEE